MEDYPLSNAGALEDGPSRPYVGLKGSELMSWALRAGPECLPDLGCMQVKYFETVSRRAGVAWPEGFFASTLEELTAHRR